MDVRSRAESMDEDVDVEYEPDDDFSEHPDYNDPARNLERLKETYRILSSGTELSAEWKHEHCVHILYYKWAMSKANPMKESESLDYQKLVRELLVLLDALARSVKATGTFSIQQYISTITRLLRVVEEATSMYELEDAMNDLLT